VRSNSRGVSISVNDSATRRGGIRQVRRRGVTAKGRKQVPDRPFSGGQVDFLAAMHNAQTPTPVRAAGRHRDLMLEFGNANGQSFREMFV
jgi:hypothetical protein